MMTINPYLAFNGNTEEAFEFYKSVFGGEFADLQRCKDAPGGDKMPAKAQEEILHISLPIGEKNVLMGSDASGRTTQNFNAGNNFHLSIQTESKEEADNFFNGVSTGGTITMPLADSFWGAYFGTCTDKFGIQWTVNYDYNSK